MEVLFEEVIGSLLIEDCLLCGAFCAFIMLFTMPIAYDGKFKTVVVIVTCCIAFVMGSLVGVVARVPTHTEYTVKVTNDSGYRQIVERYDIVEKKSDDVYVIKEKQE